MPSPHFFKFNSTHSGNQIEYSGTDLGWGWNVKCNLQS